MPSSRFGLGPAPTLHARALHALSLLALSLLLLGTLATPAAADSRRFAWSYESTTMPRGLGEYEQWVTWKTDKQSDDLYDRLEFRQELEYGLTDRLQVGLYFANWRYTRSAGGSETQVRTSSIEVIYNLSDPVTSALGTAIYGEVHLGQEKFALEGKLLLEKQWGATSVVANTILEAEWEDEDWIEDKGVFEQTLGLSRQISPMVMFGAEALYQVEFADWSETGDALLHAGPNLSVRSGGWWMTTAPLFQLSDEDGEPGLMWRTLIGILF
ncbi:MAG: hypothetical protein AB7V45_10290 [Candidatus Krumholzibacteriia bacterium]